MDDQLHATWQVGVGLCLWGKPANALAWGRLHALNIHTPQGPHSTGAWSLSTAEALQLPAHLQAHPRPLSADARAMLNVTWLLLRQAKRGMIRPAIEQKGQRWHARWQIEGWSAEQLSMALPGVCLAAIHEGEHTPPPAICVVEDMLATLADGLARQALHKTKPAINTRSQQATARWLKALHGAHSRIDADAKSAKQLATALHAAIPRPPSPCLSITLQVPERPDGDWTLQLCMQQPDGSQISIKDAWKSPLWSLRRALLVQFSRLSDQIPTLIDQLNTLPSQVHINRHQAETFIAHDHAALCGQGMDVHLPASCASIQPLSAQLNSALSIDGILQFDWQFALGEQQITAVELQRLADQKSSLLFVRGRWLRTAQSDLQNTAQVVNRPHMESLGKALTTPSIVMGAGPMNALYTGLRPPPHAPSDRFVGTLRPYQAEGLGWLNHLAALGMGCCLADDMGLGKTIQVLAHLCDAPGTSLLICPLSVLLNWQREATEFTPHLRIHVHHGAHRSNEADLVAAMAQHDMLITTYAVARADGAALSTIPWSRIILDEAQHIKNPETQTSRTIRAIPARHRIAMTGTPVENRLDELWSIMDFLCHGLLGSRTAFRRQYAQPIEKRQDPLARTALQRVIAPLLLRRKKTDPGIVCDLPPKIEMMEPCRLTVEQAALYQAQLTATRQHLQQQDLDDTQRRTSMLAALTRLKQICNHPAHFLNEPGPLPGRSGKLMRLMSLLRTILANRESVLIFTQFTAMATRLQQAIEDRFQCSVPVLHGGLSPQQRQTLIDAFQAGNSPVFVLSLRAAGTGLTLTAAQHVIHYDRWWNPAVEDQATDRAWRIGQTQRVHVRKLVCVGTIEARIDALIREKRALADGLFHPHSLGGLSDAELATLLEIPPC